MKTSAIFFMVMVLSVSTNSFADMVFMRGSDNSKQIMWQSSELESSVAITSGNNAHLYPDITPDGKMVVYVEGEANDKGADLKLVIHDLKKNEINILNTNVSGMILHPKFSKNGEFVFFSGPRQKDGKNSIYFASLKTVGTKVLEAYPLDDDQDENEEAYFPRPSSDGSFVVYQRNDGEKKEIVFFDRESDEKMIISQGMSPALSFDERLIAYTAKKDNNWNIYVYDRILKTTTEITNDSNDEVTPTFTTNNQIVFASNKPGYFGLIKIQKDGSWKRIVDSSGADDSAPQFTGDTQFTQDELPSFPAPLRSSFGTLNHNGKIYMCGGHAGAEHTYPKESFTNDFNVYNKKTNSWKTLAPRLHKAHGFQLAAYGRYIYAFGGFTFAEENTPQWKSLDVIERYDIRTNTWEIIGQLSHPRSSYVAITIDSRVYLVGGWDSTPKTPGDYDGSFHSEIDVFDMETETLSLAPFVMPNPLRRAFAGLNYNGKILLVGGISAGNGHFEAISNLTLIDPESGLSSELPPLPFGTFAPAAEMIGNELYVFGGMFKTSELNYEYVSHIYALNLDSMNWRHTGRFLNETKGFSQVFKMDERTLGILGGHHYSEETDAPVNTFEIFRK